jgi:hypothetical protein
MSGLNFSIGGKLDPSYQASLKRAESEAKAAALRIQNSLQTRITSLNASMSSMTPGSPQHAAALVQQASLQQSLLAVQNRQFVNAALARQTAAQATAGAVVSGLNKATLAGSGLNLILRETLVVFREIGRGNWTRIPGSLTLIAQGFAQLKQISLLTMGAWAIAIAGIVAAPFIFMHRVKKLTEELATTIKTAFNPEHVAPFEGKLSTISNLQKDLADEAWRTAAAYDSVSSAIGRQLDMTRERIRSEMQLLDVQKSNELAAAKNPAQREAIEKKYSQLILNKKKEERDAELKALKDRSASLPVEMAKYEDEIEKMIFSGAFVGSKRDAELTEMKKSASDSAAEYFKQLDDGEKDTRKHSASADRKILNDFAEKQRLYEQNKDFVDENGVKVYLPPSESETARANAAQARFAGNTAARNDFIAWSGMADSRERSRARVTELEGLVKKDQGELAKLGNDQKGEIADKIRLNILQAQADLKLEKARLARVDPGAPLHGREVTERQRIGFGAPQFQLLDVNKSMNQKLAQIVHNTSPKNGANGGAGSFADPFNW